MLPTQGDPAAPILVVCDAPTEEMWNRGEPMGRARMAYFSEVAVKHGFKGTDFSFVSPCAPIPDIVEGSDKRETAFLAEWKQEFLDTIAVCSPKLIMFTGKMAGRQLTDKPVKITRVRGVARRYDGVAYPVLPMLSPGHVLRRPELRDIFDTDFHMLRLIVDSGYRVSAASEAVDSINYEWREDISDILANRPKSMSFDTEFKGGLRWYKPEVMPLVFSMSFEQGHSIVSPMNRVYYNQEGQHSISERQIGRLQNQWKLLLEDPTVKKAAHNCKIDHHIAREKCNIHIQGWTIDTQLLAAVVDENMQEKSQDECVRRWVPEMSGYADLFNQTYDKEHMERVPLEDMLPYSGGDADANFRLAKRLTVLAMEDKRHWNVYRRITMPAIQAFAHVVEPHGIKINTQALGTLQAKLDIDASQEYRELIAMVPPVIRRNHAEKGLEFSRDSFVKDILFTPDGLNLRPRVFTPGTRKLPPDQQIPSVSTKEHLPFFDDIPFVAKLMKYQKLQKLRTTYVGKPYDLKSKGPTGFWQYLHNDFIHPSYMLHRTVTGRTASADPNGQNFPKRGDLAKAFRKIFIARRGYKLIECDLSQAELRIAAWMSGDPVMIRIYSQDGDIHEMTAARVMGITLEAFRELDAETRGQKRYQAKAVNFGFLYGMGWRKFLAYAKTDYGITFTEAEAQQIRRVFFQTYRALEPWHISMREFVREHHFVRSLHGAVRHLPNILSNDEGIKSECERQAINSPVQRFASDLGLIAMNRLTRDADPEMIRPVAFIHDSLVCEVLDGYEEECMSAVKFYMETPPLQAWFNLRPPIPIKADVSLGESLGEMEEMKRIVAVAPEWYQREYDLAA